MHWRAIVELNLRWTQLRDLGNLSIVKATVLIPLIGYLILFNENVLHYLRLSPDLTAGSSPPGAISTRLLLIYFGLCAIALASFLYSMYCPEEIKRYDSGTAYVQKELDHAGHDRTAVVWGMLEGLDELAFDQISTRANGSFVPGIPDEYFRRSPEKRRVHDIDAYHAYFEALDTTGRNARRWVTAMFGVGFIFLLGPSISVFTKCVRLLFNTVSG